MQAAATAVPAPQHVPARGVPAPQHVPARGVPAPQHMQALAHANRVRLARAALKRAVLAGQLGASDVIRTCPWEVETMTVGELLRSQRRWGRTRVRKFLASLALSENRELGRLTQRQRGLLAAELDAKAGRR